jgi:hypothetical protein
MLVNTATLVDGVELERTEEREPHFWAKVPVIQQSVDAPGVRARSS